MHKISTFDLQYPFLQDTVVVFDRVFIMLKQFMWEPVYQIILAQVNQPAPAKKFFIIELADSRFKVDEFNLAEKYAELQFVKKGLKRYQNLDCFQTNPTISPYLETRVLTMSNSIDLETVGAPPMSHRDRTRQVDRLGNFKDLMKDVYTYSRNENFIPQYDESSFYNTIRNESAPEPSQYRDSSAIESTNCNIKRSLRTKCLQQMVER